MMVDLFIKRAIDPELTKQLLDHIVENICHKVQPSSGNPPALQIYDPQHVLTYRALDIFGEYSVEFLLVTIELIQTQEITNYPEGNGHYGLYDKLRKGDIFSVVSAATYG
jgi:hypothetical protein